MDIWQMLTEVYHEYLKKHDDHDNQGYFSASSAGRCFKMHALKAAGKEERPNSLATLNFLRLGTLWGDDVEKAFKEIGIPGYTCHTQEELILEEFGVKGHPDAFFISDVGPEDQAIDRECILVDEKLLTQWSWKYLTDTSNDGGKGYKMQLGTYARMISDKYDVPLENFRMALFYGNRDDGYIKPVEISPAWINEAVEYWRDLHEGVHIVDFENAVPGEVHGVPYDDWECSKKKKYCNYFGTSHCTGVLK